MINFKDIKSIKSFKNLKDFILDNKESLKKAALPITVAAAVLIFWYPVQTLYKPQARKSGSGNAGRP